MEQVFMRHDYPEEKKVKLVVSEFTDYALVWWDQMRKKQRRNGGCGIDTWEDMKFVMRKRFVPSYYHRELRNKLQRLVQGSKSVEGYFKETEMALIRANVEEEEEATTARFLHGLNREISDVVELQTYVELQDLVNQSIKVEQQLKRRGSKSKGISISGSGSGSSNWRDKKNENQWRNKEWKGKEKKGESGSSKLPSVVEKNKVGETQKLSSIKCFGSMGRGHYASECPNKRAI